MHTDEAMIYANKEKINWVRLGKTLTSLFKSNTCPANAYPI